MISAYSDTYLEDVCFNLGAMMEYAVRCGFESSSFWSLFIVSNLATQIERGNPRFLAGCSSFEYLMLVTGSIDNKVSITNIGDEPLIYNKFYWAASMLSIVQQKTGLSFLDIEDRLSFKEVLRMYEPLRKADCSKFYELAIKRITDANKETNLRKIRHAAGLTQKQLAKISGLSVKTIQLYEQGKNNINEVPAVTLYKISKALGCDLEALLQKENMQIAMLIDK